jgi:hypothetical protein
VKMVFLVLGILLLRTASIAHRFAIDDEYRISPNIVSLLEDMPVSQQD